jgi:hypothetical protein
VAEYRKPPGESAGPSAKRPKLSPTVRRYSAIEHGKDEASFERHLGFMNKELKEQRPAVILFPHVYV